MLARPARLRYGPAMTKSAQPVPDKPGTTHFGFKTVGEDEKANLVKDVFDSVAGRYDLMNDLMSLGVHRLWKNTLMARVRPKPQEQLLDVGGGTGDIAFRWKKAGGGPVTVLDINAEMLAVGEARALDHGIIGDIEWTRGDAEALPFEDMTFDVYTTAFCIRNVTRIDAALREARRVLKPGGRFYCLEFSRVVVPGLDKLYDTYSFEILPRIGQAVTKDRESYQYLAESIRKFPDQETFKGMIEDAGLERATVSNLSGGVAAIHSAWRL